MSAGTPTVVGWQLADACGSEDEAAPRLQALALRSRHDAVVDALAARAGSPVPAQGLTTRLESGGAVPSTMLIPATRSATTALGTALIGMQRSAQEQRTGVALLEAVLREHGPRGLGPQDQRHLVQGAFLVGRHELVQEALGVLDRLSDAVAAGLRADLANPVVDGPGARPHPEWEQLFGSRFVTKGLVPPQVDPGAGCLFDGLRLPAARSVDGPLVSVVVPAYRPDEGLVTSVRSILDQSHAHLEVLLVDDCSGAEYAEIFARVEALDQRVRLIRQEHNGGSYLARNTALAQARGELVTTQDADDWSHPERIARQVELMVRRPDALASRSGAIRCRPDLTRQWFGYSPERMNASALMVRREGLERLGGFDQIRKGADSEMDERLRLLGEVVDVVAPLAITRLAEGSLSRADFSFGRHSPDRVLFRSAFRRWHSQLAGQEGEALAGRRDGQRPYPVPRSFVRDLPHAAPARTDYPVALLVDLAEPFPAGSGAEGLLALGGAGDRDLHTPVAVLAREDLTRAGAAVADWSPVLLDAAREGRVDLLVDGDQAHAATLVVLDPSLLAVPALPLPVLTAGRVLIAAVPPGPEEPVRDLEAASATVREHWGLSPTWVVRSPAEQAVWAAEGWRLPLLADLVTSTEDGGGA